VRIDSPSRSRYAGTSRNPPPFREEAGEEAHCGGNGDDEDGLMTADGPGATVRGRDRKQYANADDSQHDAGRDEQRRPAYETRQQRADDRRGNAADEGPARDVGVDLTAPRVLARSRERGRDRRGEGRRDRREP
jgi:hypothetical protein